MVKEEQTFRKLHREWVEHELLTDATNRQGFWSESVAVGSEHFIQDIQQNLAVRIPGRSNVSDNETPMLKEPLTSYSTLFDGQKAILSPKNTYYVEIKYVFLVI